MSFSFSNEQLQSFMPILILHNRQTNDKSVRATFYVMVDGHLNTVDGHINTVDGYLNTVDGYLNTVDGHLNTIDGNFNTVDGYR